MENSLIVPVGDANAAADALVSLACDRDLLERLRKQGLEDSGKLDERKSVDDWLSLFGISQPSLEKPLSKQSQLDKQTVSNKGKKSGRKSREKVPAVPEVSIANKGNKGLSRPRQ